MCKVIKKLHTSGCVCMSGRAFGRVLNVCVHLGVDAVLVVYLAVVFFDPDAFGAGAVEIAGRVEADVTEALHAVTLIVRHIIYAYK